MPTPVIADVYRVVWEYINDAISHNPVNVLHFSAPDKTAGDVLDLLDEFWDPALVSTMTSDTSLTHWSAQPLDGSSAALRRPNGTSGAHNGAGGSQAIPQGCVLLQLQTGLIGRENRGRIYLPHVGEEEVNDGLIVLGDLETQVAAWGTFSNDMANNGCALGVASYKNASWHQAINIDFQRRMATQRKRQPLV